jgi:hypothetical protein
MGIDIVRRALAEQRFRGLIAAELVRVKRTNMTPVTREVWRVRNRGHLAMRVDRGGYRVSDDRWLLDFDLIHEFLAQSY